MIEKMIEILKHKYAMCHISKLSEKSFKFYEYHYQILKDEWLLAIYNEKMKSIEISSFDGTINDEIEVDLYA